MLLLLLRKNGLVAMLETLYTDSFVYVFANTPSAGSAHFALVYAQFVFIIVGEQGWGVERVYAGFD